MRYEKLLVEIDAEEIEIFENNYIGRMKGLYVDGTITLNSNIETDSEKACILAEEIGHYHTTTGNILDQSRIENVKQEKRARNWAYEKLIKTEDFMSAYKYGCTNQYEIAEYLNVTEEFLIQTINRYKEKYGLYYKTDNYIIYFEPLGILEFYNK